MLQPGTRFSKAQLGPDKPLFRNGAASEPAAQPAVMSGELMGRHGRAPEVPEHAMTILKWALIFFLVSIVAGLLGFTGISAASADIARFLFYVFAVIFLVLLILGLTIFRA
jgi:uncharacterized membrane protein YtjA (UPF0391 family)